MGDLIITAKLVFDYAGDDHIVFPFLTDEGGSNHACSLVSMRLTCLSFKTLAFLCNLIHAVNDLLSSDSGRALCGSSGLKVEELGILCDNCLQ